MRKRQSIFLIISVVLVATLLGVAVPFVMMNNIETNSVTKLSEFILYDDINNKTMSINRKSFGFDDEYSYNKYYVDCDVDQMQSIINKQDTALDINISGAVLYIHCNSDMFFYLRRMSNNSVPLQGYEYNTSNKSSLVSRNKVIALTDIYLPYHMLDVAVNPDFGSDESRGIYEVNKKYTFSSGYNFDDVLSFYEQYSSFSVAVNFVGYRVDYDGGNFFIIPGADNTIIFACEQTIPITPIIPIA